MSRLDLGRLVALAALCAALVFLVEHDALRLLTWTDRLVPVSRYRLFLAAYLVGLAALAVTRAAARRPILLGLGVVTGALLDPIFVVLVAAFAAAYHAVLYARIATAGKVAFVVAVFAAWAIACNATWFPDLAAAHPRLGVLGYAWTVGLLFRTVWVFHEARIGGFVPPPRLDFLAYFLFAPLFIVLPYMLAIPRLDLFRAGLGARDRAVELGGLRTLGLGLVFAVAGHALGRLPVRPFLVQLLREGDWLLAVPVALLDVPVLMAAQIIGEVLILHGLVRSLGFELAPAFRAPLASPSILEWWRRWNIHFRDLLVELFFYPVAFRLRRRAYLSLVVASASVFLVGSALFHVPKQYFIYGTHARLSLATVAEFAGMAVIVAVALCLERRRRGRPAASRGALRLGAGIVGTWLLVCIAQLGLGGMAHLHADYLPIERAEAKLRDAHQRLRAGDPEAAGLARRLVPDLDRLVAREPRSAQRRLELALALAMTGDDAALARARVERRRARAFVDDPLNAVNRRYRASAAGAAEFASIPSLLAETTRLLPGERPTEVPDATP